MKINKLKYSGAMVLGMHDALVSLTGIIVGLTFAVASSRFIVLTCIIASVSASLSMAASNYLAEKTDGRADALNAGFYTGGAYLGTSALLTAPFMIMNNPFHALGFTFAISALIILLFNYFVYKLRRRLFVQRFLEMLIICTTVSVIAFAIGQVAKYFLGIDA